MQSDEELFKQAVEAVMAESPYQGVMACVCVTAAAIASWEDFHEAHDTALSTDTITILLGEAGHFDPKPETVEEVRSILTKYIELTKAQQDVLAQTPFEEFIVQFRRTPEGVYRGRLVTGSVVVGTAYEEFNLTPEEVRWAQAWQVALQKVRGAGLGQQIGGEDV